MVARVFELRRLAPAANLDRVILGIAVGNVRVRRVGQLLERGVAGGGCRVELLLGLPQLLLHLFQQLDLFGRGPALLFLPRAEVVDLRDELAPALVGLEPGIERLAGALARKRGPVGVRVVARGLRVDHAGAAATASGSGTRPDRRAAWQAAWRTSSASGSGTRTGCRRPGR